MEHQAIRRETDGVHDLDHNAGEQSSVDHCVAVATEGNEILLIIITQLTPGLDVVYMQVR
jgi:hypothetical protein